MMLNDELKKSAKVVASALKERFATMGLTDKEEAVAKIVMSAALASGSAIVFEVLKIDSKFRGELVLKAGAFALLYSLEEGTKAMDAREKHEPGRH